MPRKNVGRRPFECRHLRGSRERRWRYHPGAAGGHIGRNCRWRRDHTGRRYIRWRRRLAGRVGFRRDKGSGVLGVWALVAWIIGTTILKTRDTDADWGQLARGTGFAQNAGTSECPCLHTGCRGDHWGGCIFLASGGHDDCRSSEFGLHINVESVWRGHHSAHSCAYHKRDTLLGTEHRKYITGQLTE